MARVLPTEAEKMDFAENPIVSSMDKTDINSRKTLCTVLRCFFLVFFVCLFSCFLAFAPYRNND